MKDQKTEKKTEKKESNFEKCMRLLKEINGQLEKSNDNMEKAVKSMITIVKGINIPRRIGEEK